MGWWRKHYEGFKRFNNEYESWFVKEGKFILVNNKYRLSRVLFWVVSAPFIFAVLFSTYEYFSVNEHYYASCPSQSLFDCANPFYLHCKGELSAVCNQEFISPGSSVGTKPSWVSLNLGTILLATFILFTILNTLIYNKGLLKK